MKEECLIESVIEKTKLPITVVLGSINLPIEQIKGIGEGTIIELKKLAGAPVDLYLGNTISKETLIGFGEVMVLDENFAIRITHIGTEL